MSEGWDAVLPAEAGESVNRGGGAPHEQVVVGRAEPGGLGLPGSQTSVGGPAPAGPAVADLAGDGHEVGNVQPGDQAASYPALSWAFPPPPAPALFVPTPVAESRRGRGLKRVAVVALFLVLASGAVSGWLVARDQSRVAARWKAADLAALTTDQRLTSDLGTARSEITGLNGNVGTLNSEVASLDGQLSSIRQSLSSTEGQLSAVANEKAKVQDQNSVLDALVQAAGIVSNRLQTCVSESNSAWSELVTDMQNGSVDTDPLLPDNVNQTVSDCQAAEDANQNLQSVIATTTGQ